MPVAARDFYQGAALSLLIRHPAYASIRPLSAGRFLLNGSIRVWLKHSKDKSPWHFGFSPEEVTALGQDLGTEGETFLCLVCRRDSICALDGTEAAQAFDLGLTEEQSLTVTRIPGRKLQVSGPGGQVADIIMAAAFPDKVFA
ncbi:hypothetical protein [Desulfoferula mesophila]|uniref:Uncharacterized protein n=1 Tax=Desulfoferula mesophila TaxID=3058419 RepID=A0AAU9EMC0_9BACT|nr:hypothetical protein FAK_21370 [Desulfoferula mesophilus]